MNSQKTLLAWRAPPLLLAGVGLSAFTAGTLASLSLISVPTLLLSNPNTNSNKNNETSLLTGWRHTLQMGFRLCPPFAVIATMTHLLNAYVSSTTSRESTSTSNGITMYYSAIAAAVSTIAIVPFTTVFIAPTNRELFRREAVALDAAGVGSASDSAGESGTTNKYIAAAAAAGVTSKDVAPSSNSATTEELVKKWGRLNLIRALLPAVGALIAGFTW